MASAFSVCALSSPWRLSTPPGETADRDDYIDDPSWLIGINAAQLAIALVSNLFLLLNMAGRVRFAIAQPITIVGWYLSSFTLTALVATASGPLKLSSPDQVYSEAYFYAIISAGLYFMVALLMLLTAAGAYKGFYEKDFKLTMSQRTLMLQTISFLVYLLIGAVVFSYVEDWLFLDAVYWADVTLLTVGLGDYTPSTNIGRGLLFPYAIGGIIIIGLVVGSIRSLVLERGKAKLGERMLEKQRERLIKRIEMKHNPCVLTPAEEGVVSSHAKATAESDKRQMEFYLMRKVQARATSRRRWMSLVISASTWFVLWFAGAAVFQAAEVDQHWSYFDSLYFAYTSLLTIGYGDLCPKSNCGKTFFVVWSLLAVPSLTILISNMGDTIIKFIKDFTLRVGNVTVLPGEQRVTVVIKHNLRKLTNRKLLNTNILEKPGESDKRGKWGTEHLRKNGPKSAAQGAAGRLEVGRVCKEGETGDERVIPKSKRHYHSMLIKEINSVVKHLNHSPPMEYTFDEWSWYLKLIGEGESSWVTHSVARREIGVDVSGIGTAASGEAYGEEAKMEWGWLGRKSPLMGSKGEAEWVLGGLTRTLERELEAMKGEEEGNGDSAEGSVMGGSNIMERAEESGKVNQDWAGGGSGTGYTPTATGEDLEKQDWENG